MISEDELVRAIRKVLSGEAPGVAIGIGDDAAVVDAGRHHTILTTDMLIEGIHFDRTSASAHDVGHKALTVNVSDVAAMGGSPRFGLVSIGLPPEVETPWVIELYAGIREAAGEYGMAIVGGDTNRAGKVVLSITVVGAVAKDGAVTRSGARPGDRLVVTGSLGAAAGGLRLAQADPHEVREALASEWGRRLVQAHLRPVARVGEGETLSSAGATAMIDISDGLALDLSRVCAESGVGATLTLGEIPVADGLEDLAKALEGALDPLDLALHGGEDYELLAALPPEAVEEAAVKLAERFGTGLSVVGTVTEEGVRAIAEDGTEGPLEPKGWDHFA
ncbi:MAG: thiamine-phosphate kinase [Actinomycetota bacterium]